MAEHVNHMLIVLGAGMTGLGGLSGRPAFDAAENPGGVRPSFYTRPGIADRFSRASADDRCYLFEVGRGHWIFGGDSSVHRLLRSIEVLFADRSKFRYEALISALPLNRTIEMAGLHVPAKPDPSPSVLMLNIGVTKGPRCPEDHWVYAPISKAAFHRAGFYRNADTSFPPKSSRGSGQHVSTYVERSYPEGRKPDADEISAHGRNVIRELQDWGWVRDVDVMDPTRMEVADTSSWAGSQWRQKAPAALETHDIYPIGQYARWVFQGIADSIRDGLIAGAPMTASHRRSAEEAHPRQERSQGAV